MSDPGRTRVGGLYAHYVLFVLVLVYVLNFVDRNILSILAEDIKVDLGISDAEMGFLYGTVFAVFYSVFGIPLARLADFWVRRSLIAVGLGFWSLMTALSGTARSFPELALYRIGVGVGEASASPAAYSLLSDWYPPRLRATVIAIYSSGVYIGGGIGLVIGGMVLDAWTEAYPESPPLGLAGWQVAFIAVGLPGLLLALWTYTLREPRRGQSENLVTDKHPSPFRAFFAELAAVVPPLTFWSIRRSGGSLAVNFCAAAVIAIVGYLLVLLTGSVAQWIALGVGVYVTFSWAQSLARRDPATFKMMFRSRALMYVTVAFPTISFVTYGTGFWTAPYLMRVHDVSPGEVGTYIGIGNALGGLIGVTLGGVLADQLKLRFANGRLVVGFMAVGFTVPCVLVMLFTDSLWLAFFMNFAYHIPSSMWVGVPSSTATDLVMPRMRAVATAWFLLMNTFIGLALGPYVIGRLSDLFSAGGASDAEALRMGILTALAIFLFTITALVLAMRHLPRDEGSRLDRARALGESVQFAS